jgi:hypothetical protein
MGRQTGKRDRRGMSGGVREWKKKENKRLCEKTRMTKTANYSNHSTFSSSIPTNTKNEQPTYLEQ